MKKFALEVIKGETTLTTTKGTAVLQGTPKLVKTKFGSYYVFPRAIANDETLFQINLKHRVFNEFEIQDGSKAVVFRQTKATPNNELKVGDWHVDAQAVDIR